MRHVWAGQTVFIFNTGYKSIWKKYGSRPCIIVALLQHSPVEKTDSLWLCQCFFLALCLWKNRSQQKTIFAFREMSCLISLYQPITGIQWGSSSVDILSLGFWWYPAFLNAIETPIDLKKNQTNIHKLKSMSIFLGSYSLEKNVLGVSLPGAWNNLLNMTQQPKNSQ